MRIKDLLSLAAIAAATGVQAGDYPPKYPSDPPKPSGTPGYPPAPTTTPPLPNTGPPSAKVVNKCSYPVYLWSVAFDTDGPHEINCGEEYVEKYLNGGVALEIVKQKSVIAPNMPYPG